MSSIHEPARLAVVGNPEEIHIGAHFYHGAQDLGLSVDLLDTRHAFAGSAWVRRLNWRLRGHCPPRLKEFSDEVVAYCNKRRPASVLAVGMAPLCAKSLDTIGRMGVRRLNYLTDDPWNPSHRASWFLAALRTYDHVFSPRRANLGDLRQLGCQAVSYLPFGYAPEIHFPEVEHETTWDIVFAGGADRERVIWISALVRAGFKIGLYGGYWNRFAVTSAEGRGHADPATLRKAIAGSKLALCLVRRSNRDGHSMRSFEVPAMRGCMLAEDTGEHREIFGGDGQRVWYFRTIPELIQRASWLVGAEEERRRSASAAYELIANGRNTYRDRLAAMLGLPSSQAGPPWKCALKSIK